MGSRVCGTGKQEIEVMSKEKRNVHGRLNASWKICFLAINGQSFLVIDGYLLNPLYFCVRLENQLVKTNLSISVDVKKVEHVLMSCKPFWVVKVWFRIYIGVFTMNFGWGFRHFERFM